MKLPRYKSYYFPVGPEPLPEPTKMKISEFMSGQWATTVLFWNPRGPGDGGGHTEKIKLVPVQSHGWPHGQQLREPSPGTLTMRSAVSGGEHSRRWGHLRFNPVKLNIPICSVMWFQVPGVLRASNRALSSDLMVRMRSAIVFTLPVLSGQQYEYQPRQQRWHTKTYKFLKCNLIYKLKTESQPIYYSMLMPRWVDKETREMDLLDRREGLYSLMEFIASLG